MFIPLYVFINFGLCIMAFGFGRAHQNDWKGHTGVGEVLIGVVIVAASVIAYCAEKF